MLTLAIEVKFVADVKIPMKQNGKRNVTIEKTNYNYILLSTFCSFFNRVHTIFLLKILQSFTCY